MDRMVQAVAIIDILLHLEGLERVMDILNTIDAPRAEYIDQRLLHFVRGILLRFIRIRRRFTSFNQKVRRL